MKGNLIIIDESIFVIIGILFLASTLITIFVKVFTARKVDTDVYGNSASTSYPLSFEKNTTLVAKRIDTYPTDQTIKIYYALFELESGRRIEFAIQNVSMFSMMVEGDVGTLRYQGQKFLGFDRNRTNI